MRRLRRTPDQSRYDLDYAQAVGRAGLVAPGPIAGRAPWLAVAVLSAVSWLRVLRQRRAEGPVEERVLR